MPIDKVVKKALSIRELKKQMKTLQEENAKLKSYASSGKAYPKYDDAAPEYNKSLSHELRRAMVRKGPAYCTMYENKLEHRKDPYYQRMVYVNPSTTKEIGITNGSYGIKVSDKEIRLSPAPGMNEASVSISGGASKYMCMPVKVKSLAPTGYYTIRSEGKDIVIDLKTQLNPLTGNLVAR